MKAEELLQKLNPNFIVLMLDFVGEELFFPLEPQESHQELADLQTVLPPRQKLVINLAQLKQRNVEEQLELFKFLHVYYNQLHRTTGQCLVFLDYDPSYREDFV